MKTTKKNYKKNKPNFFFKKHFTVQAKIAKVEKAKFKISEPVSSPVCTFVKGICNCEFHRALGKAGPSAISKKTLLKLLDKKYSAMNTKGWEEELEELWRRYTADLSSVGFNNLHDFIEKLLLRQRQELIEKFKKQLLKGAKDQSMWISEIIDLIKEKEGSL